MKKQTLLLAMLIISAATFSQETVIRQDTVVRQGIIVKQDIVVYKNGEEIFGKVTEVTYNYIVCQIKDSVQVINRVILLEDVFMIKYANGTREVIKLTKTENNPVPKFSPAEMLARGQSDAKKYYKGNGAMWATAGTTFLFPPAGLVEGIISAVIAPKVKFKNVSDVNLLGDVNYHTGYKKQAHKKKAKKVLGGFGIGLAAFITVIIVTQY